MSIAAELHALQDLDLALDRVLARLQEIEEGLGETEELQAARLAMEEKTKVVEALKARQSDLEWAVDEVRTKAADVEGKLYGGKVTSPKELSDLDADLKSLRTQTAKREDVLLTHLVELEDAESERLRAAGEYAELESSWQSITISCWRKERGSSRSPKTWPQSASNGQPESRSEQSLSTRY